ncbi:hypothetical protein, partial [Pseudomonas sp. NFACC13-1]|uniref:hypothetical protein n=1 Tax=Pseudomonas sp. NFACC13-1 TaxID=1566245 RepID=UPI001C40B74E
EKIRKTASTEDFLGPLKKILTKGRELRICHGHTAGRVWTTGIVKGIDDAVEYTSNHLRDVPTDITSFPFSL